uniref:Phosphatidate cytidylyltransferase n=1 Tax=Chromera velia CCMP2878 TaxID=1169474 RepID=A0A0G4FEP4_9ALVE|eukprot:Cvel_16630.t1-p1 / transcript=Cvel_16630.t1 / gene=Cvel_16630 / organism=Chromera_velia_CCMP2878 / gene_product=Phosphatidate cytidylyltransferase, putative / transcript_product=Phosphatidate cytidylyltransferase, putative / location=Cvel_scaffold1289:21363-26223(+) / protein_length=336 / sequence_SO=supercontig / SO=protein_coding / is_pseudo=false
MSQRSGVPWGKRALTFSLGTSLVVVMVSHGVAAKALGTVALCLGGFEYSDMVSSVVAAVRGSPVQKIEGRRHGQMVLILSTLAICLGGWLHGRPSAGFLLTVMAALLADFAGHLLSAVSSQQPQQPPGGQKSGGTKGEGGSELPGGSGSASLAVSVCLTLTIRTGLDAVYLLQYVTCLIYGLFLLDRDKGVAILWLAVSWMSDTGALIAGRLFGRVPLAPTISPAKSCEGVAGAFVFGLLTAYIIFLLRESGHGAFSILPGLGLGHSLALAFLVTIMGVVGDLLESALKRSAGVKDASKLLPGHGGVLDRLDSLTLSAPFVFTYASAVLDGTFPIF